MGEMHDQSDAQLLRAYAEHGTETTFAEIVARHTDLVYSAALRQVYSPDLARDVTQSVFTDLARKAREVSGKLSPEASLVGWLYRATRFAARNLNRTEIRRTQRERQAMEQLLSDSGSGTGAPPVWSDIASHLDDAMSELNDTDRDAVLLHYFKNHDLRTVGATLGISDDAAQKRVSRAVERLREFFAKRGVTVGASGLVVIISANAVQAAPVGLALTISTAAALTGTTFTTTATVTATKAIAMTALQKTIVTATIAVLTGAGIYQAHQAAQLRDQVQTLQQQQASLEQQIQRLHGDLDFARNRSVGLNAGLASSNSQWQATRSAHDEEIRKLKSELETKRQENEQLAALASLLRNFNESALNALREGKSNLPISLEDALVKQALLLKACDDFRLKHGAVAPQKNTPEGEQYETEWRNLVEQATPLLADEQMLDALNSTDPAMVARSQLWLLAGTLDLDAAQIQAIDRILLQNYQAAFARGLNGAAQPEADRDVWEDARSEFSAAVFAQLTPLLNSNQQGLFDRTFMSDFMFRMKLQLPDPPTDH